MKTLKSIIRFIVYGTELKEGSKYSVLPSNV